MIAETDDNGNLQVVYTYGVDGLVSSRVGGQSYFYHFDGLGSTRAMTDGNAQLVEVYDYEAFGNELLSQGGLATAYRYVGQLGYYRHDDVELGLLGARCYAPEFGRFLTRDPLGQAGGPNLYAYAGDSPANRADPTGMTWTIVNCGDKTDEVERAMQDLCRNRVGYVQYGGLRWCMRLRCSDPGAANALIIKCEPATNPNCAGNCAYLWYHGGVTSPVVHLCPLAFDPNRCGCVGKTLIHELAHVCGGGEDEEKPRLCRWYAYNAPGVPPCP